ncbi:MAG: DUF1320 family protein [Bacteroidetes bacterium]|nr:DUF1320 family protein [Bacteroidota bacterium]
MPFITKTDFDASVHEDILNALTKNNDDVITENANRAIAEMRAYLNGRYNNDAIFSAEGIERNSFILRIGLCIAKYYIFLTHNPRKITQSLKEEYDKAIEDLEKIQKGKLNPEGLPIPIVTDTTQSNGFPMQWGSLTQTTDNW